MRKIFLTILAACMLLFLATAIVGGEESTADLPATQQEVQQEQVPFSQPPQQEVQQEKDSASVEETPPEGPVEESLAEKSLLSEDLLEGDFQNPGKEEAVYIPLEEIGTTNLSEDEEKALEELIQNSSEEIVIVEDNQIDQVSENFSSSKDVQLDREIKETETGFGEEFTKSISSVNSVTPIYVTIEQLIGKSEVESQNNTPKEYEEALYNPQAGEEKLKYVLAKEGQKELETEIFAGQKIEIKKEEKSELDVNWEKEVKIYSQEHWETPIRTYSEIIETESSRIKIYWLVNGEFQEITSNPEIALEFYDRNENGLYDHISWIVPHLSEQYYKIVIEVSNQNAREEITILKNSPEEGVQLGNPVFLSFNISANNSLAMGCVLYLDEKELMLSGNNMNITESFSNGEHYWKISCKYLEKPYINQTLSGSFFINSYSILSLEKKMGTSGSDLTLNINLTGNSEKFIEIIKPSNVSKRYNLPSTQANTSFIIPGEELKEIGTYLIRLRTNANFDADYFEERYEAVSLNISANKQNADINEQVHFIMDLKSFSRDISWYLLDFGDGQVEFKQNINSKQVYQEIAHAYGFSKQYTLNLSAGIGEVILQSNRLQISVNSSMNIDTQPPIITLLTPEQYKKTEERAINFTYTVEDNIKIKNCTFELYNYSGVFEKLIYAETKSNIVNKSEILLQLKDFKEGAYSWYVGCYDNSTNFKEERREFTILLTGSLKTANNSLNNPPNSSEYKKIQIIQEKIDNFLYKANEFGLEEKEALEELGFIDILAVYKRRLIQLESEINILETFVTSSEEKKERLKTINKELDSIEEDTPEEIRLIKRYEYTKAEPVRNLRDIVETYLKEKNMELGSASFNRLIRTLEKLQKEVVVKAKLKNIEVTYSSKKREIGIISKEIAIKSNSSGNLIEFLPKELTSEQEEIKVLNSAEVFKERNLFEIEKSSLKEERIVYFIEKLISEEEIESTETILLPGSLENNEGLLTGFLVYAESAGKGIGGYLLGFILFGAITFFVFKKWRKTSRITSEAGNMLREQIKFAERFLEIGEIDQAQEEYKRLREVYNHLLLEEKKAIYSSLFNFALNINRKKISLLIKEYAELKKQKKENEAIQVYRAIQEIYKVLPREYKKKAYNILTKPLS